MKNTATTLTIEEKRKRLQQKLKDQLKRNTKSFPLHHGQQSLWFLQKVSPECSAYNLGEALLILEDLTPALFQKALQRLVARHAALRTTFPANDDGVPVQKVHPYMRVPLDVNDVSDWDEARLERFLADEINAPFDFDTGPLLRVGLYKRAAGEHILLLSIHHIISEFWSEMIIASELCALYIEEKKGIKAQLPPLNKSYIDFVQEQNNMLAGAEGDRLWSYWKQQLSGDLPLLQLPYDFQRPAEKTYRGKLTSFAIDDDILAKAITLTKESGVTLYMTLLAAYFTFLHRYTGQKDMIVGTPMTGRMDQDWMHIVGYMNNTIPIRLQMREKETFSAMLKEVKTLMIDAMKHQAMPFSLLVERLQPQRDPSRSLIFDTLFLLRKSQLNEMQAFNTMGMGMESAEATLNGIKVKTKEVERHVAQLDITLVLAEVEGKLHGAWEYNTDLFTAETIKRMTDNFNCLLRAVVECPDAMIDTLPILGEPNYQNLVVEANATDTSFPKGKYLHQGFEDKAKQTPEAIAIYAEDRTMTYKQLDEEATKVAGWLMAQKVQPNQLVAVSMRKGWEQVVAVLGILKAGAAYLPLDPNLPEERKQYLLEVSDITVVCTQESYASYYETYDGVQVLSITPSRLKALPIVAVTHQATVDDLAYVIFTSGSTGVPKGVMITHDSVVNTLYDMNMRFSVVPSDRVFALSSLSFDLSVYDIFGTLQAGAAIVIPDATRLQEPSYWIESVEKYGITIWNSVPALLQLLAEALEGYEKPFAGLASLRLAWLSGDWIPMQLTEQILEYAPQLNVHSLGGATEGSIWSITYPITTVDPTWKSIPYGKPMYNQKFYILNSQLQPCPMGVQGELYIGGVGVAAGYWKNEKKTNESFIIHPVLQERLYKTGDLGRYLPDGNIEFLGRADFQVKIKGFRVELGEIEYTLRQHESVQEAIVIARGSAGQNQLYAYVKCHRDVSVADLRDHTTARLPEYMVPTAFMVIEQFPLTANGKVDTKALPHPNSDRANYTHTYEPPKTATEKTIIELWSSILGIPTIGRHDTIFELGADSVLGIQFCAKARKRGLLIRPRDLFEHPTIAELAAVAEPIAMDTTVTADGVWQGVAESDHTQLSEQYPTFDCCYPLAPMQQTMLMHTLQNDTPAVYTSHAIVKIKGKVTLDLLMRSWEQLIQKYEVLRTVFEWETTTEPLQIVLQRSELQVHTIDWSHVDASEFKSRLTQYIENDRAKGFDLHQTPLMRLALIQRASGEFHLVWAHHHMIMDGWSMTLVLREWMRIYEAMAAQQSLVETSIAPYQDYITWHKRQDMTLHENFWRSTLADFESPTPLTVFEMQGYTEDTPFLHQEQEVQLTPAERQQLVDFAQANGITVNTVIQGAWALVLAKYSREKEVLFGVTVSGRPIGLERVEDMVGLFINTLPLRVKMENEEMVLDWLKAIQHLQLSCQEYDQATPIDIESWSSVPREERNFGLYETVLVYENYPMDDALKAKTAGVEITDITFYEQTNTPMLLYVFPGEVFDFRMTYDGNRFASTTITQLLEHFVCVIKALVATPKARIDSISMLTTAQAHDVVYQFNTTVAEYPSNKGVHQFFFEQAVHTPEAIALRHGEVHLSYEMLATRVRQASTFLTAQGVTKGQRVGLYVARSTDMIIYQLATLSIGGVFVPIDTNFPAERVQHIVTNAEVKVLLTQTEMIEKCTTLVDHVTIIPIDTIALDTYAAQSSVITPADDDPAYIIYTSGSTGMPKGVMIGHKAFTNFVLSSVANYEMTDRDTIMQFASISFDTSIEEIYPALVSGAEIVLRNDAMLASIPVFFETCVALGITILDLPTTFWHEMVSGLVSGAVLPECVRLVIIGGEKALPSKVQWWQDHVQVSLLNTYGPTEATVVTTVMDLTTPQALFSSTEVPIGYPLANTRVYILDVFGQPQPVGVPGELCIAGDQLSLGYCNAITQTEQSFTTMTIGGQSQRVYKSGDLAQWSAEGVLYFAGRIDNQVKISGYRVEPSEVEATLVQHSAVSNAAVLPLVLGSRQTLQLVAYVTTKEGSTLSASQLKTALQKQLPSYMIPTVVMFLDTMPITINGKIAYKALPYPEEISDQDDCHDSGTWSKTETVLISLCETMLAIKGIRPNDDFFTLGGQSLQAIQLVAKVSKVLKQDIPVRLLLLHPRIADLAKAIDETYAAANTPSLDLHTEARLEDFSITSLEKPETTPDKALLTGATGFLGAYLLTELLARTTMSVAVLIRAKNKEEGAMRLRHQLQEKGIWDDTYTDRIEVLVGDLAKPLLGLSSATFTTLSQSITHVYHNGAIVNHVYPYEALKAANVGGTKEILTLVSTGITKALHYISTVGVFNSSTIFEKSHLFEHDPCPDPSTVNGGYSQSKWVAEQLVLQARDLGINATIYRPGRITGHTTAAVFNQDDMLMSLIKGCIQLGKVPDIDMKIDMTPVDYASQSIIQLSLQEKSNSKIFHIASPNAISLTALTQWINGFGYPLEQQEYGVWRAAILAVLEREEGKDNALFPFLAILKAMTITPSDPIIDCKNTVTHLEGTSVQCPTINHDILTHYFENCIAEGFLTSPMLVG